MLGTVLIVDGDVQIRRQLRRYIIMSGVRATKISECDRGADALQICQLEQVNLVLTELELPDMDGIELIERLNGMKQVPLIVVISGKKEFEDAVRLMRLGVRDYLPKPLNREQIYRMLRRMDMELVKLRTYRNYCDSIQVKSLQQLLLSPPSAETGMIPDQLEAETRKLLEQPYAVICGSISEEQLRERTDIILGIVNEEQQSVLVVAEADVRQLVNGLHGCYVGISQLHKGVNELSTGYAEGWRARKAAYFEGKSHRFTGLEAKSGAATASKPDGVEMHLIEQAVNMIGTNHLEDAVNVIQSLVKEAEHGEKNPDQFETIIRYFVNHAEKVYQNVIHEMDDEDYGIKKLYDYQSCRDYQKNLIEWMYQLNSVIESRFGDYRNKQKIQQALQFIHENFQTNLNMAVVTNHVSMNYSLFSFSFKQYTGSNFVDYLKNLRIRQAKKLLAETDMRIMDVSRSVGYDNEKHFTKVFKAECGVSPSEYRKNMLYGL